MNSFRNFTKTLVILLSVFFFLGQTMAQKFEYHDSWGKQGFQLTQQKSSGVDVIYSINNFTLSKTLINNETMDAIELPGTFLFNDEGAPNLPGHGRYIAVPEGATANVEIVSMRKETFSGIEMEPAPRIPWDTEVGDLDYNKDPKFYGENAFYPAQPVKLSEITEIRGIDVVMLGVTPFQYNPVTKELIVYRDLQIEVTFSGGSGQFGDNRLRSRWWDPLLSDILLNYESLPKMNYNHSYKGTKDVGCEYLIITPTNPEFLQWADSIRQFRNLQGILTDVMTVAEVGGNNVTTIENFVNNAYNTWDIVPSAILILGDYGTNAANSITSPIWQSYCVSDNIWADVTGNSMPDIIFARMTAQNASQLQVMVTKQLNYERNPPTSAYFYSHPISALGFQTERWFQICSEAVAGFWENQMNKSTVRVNKVYIGNPMSDPWSTATNTTTVVNIFGPSGLGYIPSTPAQVNCSWNGSAQDVVNAINNGAFMLQHRDHGYEQGWGEPAFTSSNISSLNNTDLVFVWSVNCLTGKYNYSSEVFAEKFHRYTYGGQNSGCLGINAASEVSYSFVNDTYVWGAYDNMWPNFLPTYGSAVEERGLYPAYAQAAGKYFLQASNWPYNVSNKEVTYNLFHHHGDAFMVVYSEIPMDLTVIHNPILYAGVTSFDVTANEGAFIALTVNGEIIGTGLATGGPVSITIPAQQPPDQVIVTITKQNYYRYSAAVEVIPPAGPYVVYNAVELNDDAGNGNGIMETGEAILASLTVENVGVEVGQNVSVTINTADPYVTITDDSEIYGNIAPGATAMVEDGFAWQVGNNIPDMHQVIFELNATDGTDIWSTFFSVQGHGPNLVIGEMVIDDSQGNNNGRLDPGENATIQIETSNTGSYHAIGTVGTVTITSGFITLLNNTHNFNVLGSGLTATAEFDISISTNTPVGTVISIIYNVVSGGYTVQETFGATVGLIVEDWESGNMNQYNWQTSGNAGWIVSTLNPYEGMYCAKSGTISHNQNSILSLVDYEVFSAGTISFMYKVSSESNYDYLQFYIDNVMQDQWSGEIGWTEATYAVTAGTHTFKWQYMKDGSVSTGQDAGFIDFIILPPPPVTTAYAGPDGEICGQDPYQNQGAATLYNVVYWTTSGSGSFNDPTILEPVYTPSTADVEAGEVTLSLTAYYGSGTQVTDDMTLTIAQPPVAFAGLDAETCVDMPYELLDALAENYVSVMWSTAGDGTFNDNQVVNPTYTPGTMDLENGSVVLSFVATGNEMCDPSSDEVLLTFVAAAAASAGNDQIICSNGSIELVEASAENYTSLLWTTSGDGSFVDNTVLNPVYTPGNEDINTGLATLTLTAYGMANCSEAVSSVVVSIEKMAEGFAGDDHAIAEGETYLISDSYAYNQESVEWITSGDGLFDDATSINPVYTPGANDISAKECTLTLKVYGNDPCGDVSDEMLLTINTLGVHTPGAYQVTVFPNPSSGKFTLQINGNRDETIQIRLFNALGDLVYVKENVMFNENYQETMDLSLEQGIYYLKIEGRDAALIQKIIIQK